MDKKNLRNCFGNFATGVIIASAKKKNFLTETFFADKFFDNEKFIKKFDEFWSKFSQKSYFNNSIAKKFNSDLLNVKFEGSFLQKKLKKIFADEFFGMTINSFSSLSLDPPLIQFSIDNKSSNLKLFKSNRYFSLNILSIEQKNLSNAFATPKNSEKWQVEPFIFGKFGNPIFQNSIAFIECQKYKVIKAGDHHIIIGKVLDFGNISKKEPLIYYKGKYAILSNESDKNKI